MVFANLRNPGAWVSTATGSGRQSLGPTRGRDVKLRPPQGLPKPTLPGKEEVGKKARAAQRSMSAAACAVSEGEKLPLGVLGQELVLMWLWVHSYTVCRVWAGVYGPRNQLEMRHWTENVTGALGKSKHRISLEGQVFTQIFHR